MEEVIKSQRYLNNKKLQEFHVQYNLKDGKILPIKYYKRKGDGNIDMDSNEDIQIEYHLYDDYANPLELSKAEGSHIYYLWGYEGQYPIAKIENTTRAALEAVLGYLKDVDESALPLINGLRSNDTFKDAMITTYTYDPLIGMTSMTDPRGRKTTYDYDAYGRLESTRDADNYLLEEYKYHYRNQ